MFEANWRKVDGTTKAKMLQERGDEIVAKLVKEEEED